MTSGGLLKRSFIKATDKIYKKCFMCAFQKQHFISVKYDIKKTLKCIEKLKNVKNATYFDFVF